MAGADVLASPSMRTPQSLTSAGWAGPKKLPQVGGSGAGGPAAAAGRPNSADDGGAAGPGRRCLCVLGARPHGGPDGQVRGIACMQAALTRSAQRHV